MRLHFYILTFTFALAACNQNGSTTKDQKISTVTTKATTDTLVKNGPKKERLSFKNIDEVVQDKKSNGWIELKDSSASLALHFNLVTKDTLEVAYSVECWLYFPYKVSSDTIMVYWDNIIDTKYDFDIVKAISKTDKKYIGKPFMILELVNDTTLKATYPIPDLIRKINSSSKKRTFFPDKFIVSQEFYL